MNPAEDRLSGDRVKHLEFIQAVIARLANDSFLMKGWSLTVAGIIFGFAARESSPGVALVGFLPVLVFWGLDGYFLRQERLFRRLYDYVRNPAWDVEPFSMHAEAFRKCVKSWPRTMLSRTLLPFYGAMLVVGSIIVIATCGP